MTAALGGEWSAARPGRTLPPGKTRYPLYRRMGGPQGRSERAENLVPTGIRSRTVQPVVSRYIDLATRPTHFAGAHCNWRLSRAIVRDVCASCDERRLAADMSMLHLRLCLHRSFGLFRFELKNFILF